MRNWTNVLGFLFLAWFWVPLSQATLLLVSTDVTSTISFSNLSDFSGAQVHVNHSVTQTANAAGDSGAMTFNFLGGPPFNVTVTGDSHIAISALSVSPTQATFTRTSTDGLTGKFELDFYRNANPGTNFSTSVIGGANVLEYIHNPNWTLVPGSPFTFEIVMPGDWSVAGLTSGTHALLSINPLWTIDQNFVFSGGVTTFSGHINSYLNDGLHNAQVNFQLFGFSVVPEPATSALLSLGLAGLGWSRRKKA